MKRDHDRAKGQRELTSEAQLGRGLHHLVVVFGEALVHPFVVPHDRRYAERRTVVTRNFAPAR